MTTTPKPPIEQKHKPDKTEELGQLIEKHLANCQTGRYKIIYDVPSENMQPLFDILSSSGWRLHSVVPAIVSATGAMYPTQFVFERGRAIAWTSPLFWLPLLLGLLYLVAMFVLR